MLFIRTPATTVALSPSHSHLYNNVGQWGSIRIAHSPGNSSTGQNYIHTFGTELLQIFCGPFHLCCRHRCAIRNLKSLKNSEYVGHIGKKRPPVFSKRGQGGPTLNTPHQDHKQTGDSTTIKAMHVHRMIGSVQTHLVE